ncbi:MAG: Crp/Fnr family transcriptional regulator [Bacteroidaceae bacterium]|nr:Crp/Fnr family transcriptional regulator [Bacteroidaceae bacterium]
MSKRKIETEKILEQMAEFFDTLTLSQQEELKKHVQVRSYKKNELFYGEGEIPDTLYCLLQGKVKISKEGASGRNQIMRVANAVEYFGYRAALAGEPFITAAAAFEPSIVATMPLWLIKRYMEENPKVGLFFVRRLAIALGQSDERTVNLTQKHMNGRLAESLIFLRDNYGLEEDGCTLSLYLSREDLANLSNMTTANAIRTLSTFAKEKIVAIDGKKIKLIDMKALEKINRLG